MSTRSTGSDDDYGYGDDDYGYEDMDALPESRPYAMPKDKQIPDVDSFGGNVPFVTPKSSPTPQSREYTVQKEEFMPQLNNRPYVMPKNQEINSGMDAYLQNRMNDESENSGDPNESAAFKLDAVDPEAADDVVTRYLRGRSNTADSDELLDSSEVPDEDLSPLDRLNSFERRSTQSRTGHKEYVMPGQYGIPDHRNETTARTEDESFDGPEGSYAEISLKFGSVVSTPETLKGESVTDQRSRYGTVESAADFALDGRANNTISWDTMDLNTNRGQHVGQPLQAMKSLYMRDTPIPEEVTIICASTFEGKENMCLTDRLEDAEVRSDFLEGKLEMSDDLIEAIFKDLERARLCIHDLVYRNVHLAAKLKEKKREDLKVEYQEGEVVVEQYWLLKGSMYVGLFFSITGGYEFFMAAVILIWLILEANLST
jgi:hypothetical protein